MDSIISTKYRMFTCAHTNSLAAAKDVTWAIRLTRPSQANENTVMADQHYNGRSITRLEQTTGLARLSLKTTQHIILPLSWCCTGTSFKKNISLWMLSSSHHFFLQPFNPASSSSSQVAVTLQTLIKNFSVPTAAADRAARTNVECESSHLSPGTAGQQAQPTVAMGWVS